MHNTLFYIPQNEDERDYICGKCYYGSESFNLIWCKRHEKTVGFMETCPQWARKNQPIEDLFGDGELDDFDFEP